MKNLRTAIAALALTCAPLGAATETPAQLAEREDFIAANTLWIFYHELGHALIDQLDLPVLGKEEDAADQLAILLSDALWDRDRADQIASDVALAFWLAGQDQTEPPAWWDEHSTDQQRHYTVACLYYAGDPERRRHVLDAVDLPPERVELCEAERAQVEHAWGDVMDGLADAGQPGRVSFRGPDAASDGATDARWTPLLTQLLSDEVAALNDQFRLPKPLTVALIPCGEENAFYDPDLSEIQICTEYPLFLDRLLASGDEPGKAQ
ncbi:DUF4344 domain-containing metallopeptidase [Paracoccus sp. (in: a-proteobacteria)]|uniref:DUF4344 domain-containing metallopeptidase n=1 Tax=Paracoccus sp. TaxID=267 RepID=UPI0026DEF16A|nr:DUF4344 domain-containing metallopeptidase [Paracoccus sp. (in: a-proteobacteria)]MDO5647153.1 DUF4344 domain-containing metallopeptidase [Paracoccus sp. (in: a-proteobacteria)]